MIFGWIRRKTTGKKQLDGPDMDLKIPNHFRCPISLDLMKDPVTLSSGITYDRESIEKWLQDGNFTCPVTAQVLRSFDQIPNHTLREMIQEWCVENKHFGVDRIPTPRVPVSAVEVLEILVNITASRQRLDRLGCLALVQKIKIWGSESERNRQCIVVNGTASVLAGAFDAFAADSLERNANVLQEILSTLTWMFPLDAEAKMSLGSQASLRCMVWFLKHTDSEAKQHSLITLKELLSCDQQYVEALAAIEGVNETLFQFVRDPVSTSMTKASLMVIFNLVWSTSSSTEKIKLAFVEMGLVSVLINIMIDSERSVCEKALGVVNELCDCEEGREEAYNNALSMPVLVKKILRVSNLATEYSVSIIWKLISHCEKKHEGRVLVEALQVGAFQKLLVLLQVGCEYETKEKATELLKLLNPYRAGLECIESVDFKYVKRSF